MDDNSNPNNPLAPPSTTPEPNQGLQTPTPISDPTQTASEPQTQQLPDYSSNPSQMQTEANQQPIPAQPDVALQPSASTPNPWDQLQSQQAPEEMISPAQNPGMSDQLNSANFNAPPQPNQPLPGEPQANLPVGSIPTDSRGIPHFASQEGGVSSYSPFQTTTPEAPPSQAPQPQETTPPADTPEPAPTDLSQLTGNANGQNTQSNGNGVYTPPVANTDTLVVSSEPSSIPNTTISSEPRKGLPLIAIIGALFVLLVVAGASAYFILGIGQTQVPTQETPTPSPVPAQTPTQTPTPEPSPSDTESVVNGGSSDFGSLSGEPTTSGGFQTATSAADLIRQRQQASQSPAPTPVQ